jgi:hypothetical protein
MKVNVVDLDAVESESNELVENKGRLETIVNEIDKGGLTDRNYKELSRVYSKIKEKPQIPIWKQVAYIMFRPPLTASFMGFIVGFITVIKNGIYDKTTIIYVYYTNIAIL